jgi:outer membrane protein OmpA-like peptidoglycan-associated protein
MRRFLSVVFVLVISATACMPPVLDTDGLTPVSLRLTDEVIARDRARLAELEESLRARATTEDPWGAYALAKARAWQWVAYTEYTDNDRTGIADFAFREAHRLMVAFDDGRWDDVVQGPMPEGGHRVRDDLWSRAEAVRADDWFGCGAAWVARAEVSLAWAGNEERTHASRDPMSYEERAEDYLERAEAAAEACVPPPPAPPPPPPPPLPPEPEPEPEPEPVRYQLPSRVHFGAGTPDLSSGTRRLLDEVAAVMTEHPGVLLSLQSHVESVGALAYHEELARGRAEAVRAYLVRRGVDAAAITVRTPEPRQPLQLGEAGRRGRIRAAAWPELDRARERRVDLTFTAPRLVIIQTVFQETDLQVADVR